MSELRIVLLIWTLLLTMALAAYLAVQRRAGAVLLALVSLVWLLVDGDFEGIVLINVTPHNGLTTSDLVGVAGFCVAVLRWLGLSRRRRR